MLTATSPSSSSSTSFSRPNSPTAGGVAPFSPGSPPASNSGSASANGFIHHFRICPMREAIDLKRSLLNNQQQSSSSSLSRLLSQSTLSLRSCHFHFVAAAASSFPTD
ncbi:hypothetical protein TYRP_020462 [Tyrophagus putrescentiae]|nr:hypothetical protein TYRP_020462 [Tyrophagus putrescentiae]